MFLSYSRGSLIAAGLGVIALVRVRAAAAAQPARAASSPAVVSAPVLVWALGKDQFTKDGLAAAERATVGPEFGLILVAMCADPARDRPRDRLPGPRLDPELPRCAGAPASIAVAVALAIPLMLLTSVAFSSRGLPGTVSDRFKELTSESAKTPGGPQRLIHASSTRGRYWRQAGHVFSDLPVTGTGAGTFGIARLHYRKDQLVVQHAHGFVAQTAADLGTLGLIAILALAGAWFVSAARTTGLERHPGRREGAPRYWDADRVAMSALALAAIVFGVPLGDRLDVVRARAGGDGDRASPATWPGAAPRRSPPARRRRSSPRARRSSRRSTCRGCPPSSCACRRARATSGSCRRCSWSLLALVAAWAVYQPYRAEKANTQALDAARQRQARRRPQKKAEQRALDQPGVGPSALGAGGVAVAQKNLKKAEVLYQRAVFDQPSNPEAWMRLAEFELYRNNQPKQALEHRSAARCTSTRARRRRRPSSSTPGASSAARSDAPSTGAGGGRAARSTRPPRRRPPRRSRSSWTTPSSSTRTPQHVDQRMAEAKALGFDRVRVSVYWRVLAPKPDSEQKPRRRLRATRAGTARASGTATTASSQLANAHGLGVLFSITGPSPLWVTGTPKQGRTDVADTWDPSADEFNKFVTAIGRRYSGSYQDEHEEPSIIPLLPPTKTMGPPLPRVDHWSIWNEPNHGGWLTPQWDGTPLVPQSPRIYRGLVDAGWSGAAEHGPRQRHDPDRRDRARAGSTPG